MPLRTAATVRMCMVSSWSNFTCACARTNCQRYINTHSRALEKLPYTLQGVRKTNKATHVEPGRVCDTQTFAITTCLSYNTPSLCQRPRTYPARVSRSRQDPCTTRPDQRSSLLSFPPPDHFPRVAPQHRRCSCLVRKHMNYQLHFESVRACMHQCKNTRTCACRNAHSCIPQRI